MFDAFYSLETVEQRQKYLEDTFTPIVSEALLAFQKENGLQGTVKKDIYFEASSGYGADYALDDRTEGQTKDDLLKTLQRSKAAAEQKAKRE